METDTAESPDDLASLARSSVMPRPPVVMEQRIPWSTMERAMTCQSSRR